MDVEYIRYLKQEAAASTARAVAAVALLLLATVLSSSALPKAIAVLPLGGSGDTSDAAVDLLLR